MILWSWVVHLHWSSAEMLIDPGVNEMLFFMGTMLIINNKAKYTFLFKCCYFLFFKYQIVLYVLSQKYNFLNCFLFYFIKKIFFASFIYCIYLFFLMYRAVNTWCFGQLFLWYSSGMILWVGWCVVCLSTFLKKNVWKKILVKHQKKVIPFSYLFNPLMLLIDLSVDLSHPTSFQWLVEMILKKKKRRRDFFFFLIFSS